jgi:hypothetical protein
VGTSSRAARHKYFTLSLLGTIGRRCPAGTSKPESPRLKAHIQKAQEVQLLEAALKRQKPAISGVIYMEKGRIITSCVACARRFGNYSATIVENESQIQINFGEAKWLNELKVCKIWSIRFCRPLRNLTPKILRMRFVWLSRPIRLGWWSRPLAKVIDGG